MMLDLRSELRHYGACEEVIKLLDAQDDATLLRYVDLLSENAARKGVPTSSLPAGIVEYDDRPLIYLYHADALAISPEQSSDRLAETIRLLACRGDGHYLAIVFPGELVVYPIGLMKTTPTPGSFHANSERAPLLVSELANGDISNTLKQQLANARSLHDILFELIMSVATPYRKKNKFSKMHFDRTCLTLRQSSPSQPIDSSWRS